MLSEKIWPKRDELLNIADDTTLDRAIRVSAINALSDVPESVVRNLRSLREDPEIGAHVSEFLRSHFKTLSNE